MAEIETVVEDLPALKGPQVGLKGIPASPGIVLGLAFVIKPESIFISEESVTELQIPTEIERFKNALVEVIEEYDNVLTKVKSESKNAYAVLETNMLILEDSYLCDSIISRIANNHTAETAVINEFDHQKGYLLNAKDGIFRDRAVDLEQIKYRLILALKNKKLNFTPQKNSIIIAHSITPADIIKFKEAGVVGIVTEVGGISSHSSILARSFDITEVIGVKDITYIVNDGDCIILDGYAGTVLINPVQEYQEKYEHKKLKEKEHKKLLGKLIKEPSVTLDGKEIKLLANINFLEDIEALELVGDGGIGLVRTENLVITDGKFPNLETQYSSYNSLAEQCYPHTVTFRVFDVGSDKYVEGLPKHENNPALGYRGIRFLLHRKDIFKTQICALLKASKHKNVKLMLPMISSIEEVKESVALINECKKKLAAKNIPIDNDIPIGVMIETPAAALLASHIAEYCDFFSIGTNDLTQYTLATDRENELVSNQLDTFHPSVLKLIKYIIDSSKRMKIPVAICGEMAGHSAATCLLIGMGVDELSVAPSIILELKKRIRETDLKKAEKL